MHLDNLVLIDTDFKSSACHQLLHRASQNPEKHLMHNAFIPEMLKKSTTNINYYKKCISYICFMRKVIKS